MSVVSAAFVLAVLAQSTPAPLVWGLTWDSPNVCIRPADLAERIEQHRGGQALFGALPGLRLEGRVASDGGGWRARVTLVDKQGTVLGNRELQNDSSDCRALDERLVVIASLLMDTVLTPTVSPQAPMVPPPMPPTAVRPYVQVMGERHVFDGVDVSLETFYRRLGRRDLVESLQSLQVKRLVGFTLGGVGALAGAVVLGAYAGGVGCQHYAGSPLLPGACLERSTGLLVTSLVLMAAGVVTLLVTNQFDTAPTTLVEDTAFARAANQP